jgi:CRP/FNR family cyclic AMP-dependent transcriptional regulator
MGQNRYEFDPEKFLSTIGEGRTSLHVSTKELIFAQGDPTAAVFYIQRGNVKMTILSGTGKEATIGILGAGDFFGEACLAGQLVRMGSALAMTSCDLLRIEQLAMKEALHREHKLSDLFVSYLLTRNIRYQQDLVDQLFNSSEKRLARVLLLLARFGKDGEPDHIPPEISQTTLAEMVGTTRSRINLFLKRFKQYGFIHYDHGLQVHSSLVSVLLDD